MFIDDEATSDRLCDLGQGLHTVGDRAGFGQQAPKPDMPWSPSDSYLRHETSGFLPFMQSNAIK